VAFLFYLHILQIIFFYKKVIILQKRGGKEMKKEEFKPYISDEHVQTEFTPTSIIIGILLSVVFGAANAYLGLRVGLPLFLLPLFLWVFFVLYLEKTQYWKVIWYKP
jgi:hypothetical protein